MFAIIDIETCGGKYEFRKGRITEICILLHDGLQVTEKFTTLIDPECNISPYFTSLTGITNDMVAGKPKFHEIAQKVWEMTENRVFVAHNVGFDYGFIRDEFASLGAKFRRETLCTVRLSRKLIPGKISYSLGTLCSSLGIENEARHRAEGDAVATAKLFDLLMQLKTMNPLYKNQGVVDLMTRRIDKMKKYILDKLPEECGVYYFKDKKDEIIYIGKSINVYHRALGHFNSKEHKGKKMLNDLYQADFNPTGSELIALLMEAEEIKKHKPKYNRARKAHQFTHCIDWFRNDQGIINFKIVEYEQSENALCSFTGYLSAREKLESWMDDHTLCMTHTGLAGEDAVCFNHQIKKCNGICNGEEDVRDYNKRASEILEDYIFKDPDFVLIDRGRHHEERSLILIENGHFAGYGYIGESDTFSTLEDVKSFMGPVNYYPDADDLVRGWLKRNNVKKIVLKKSLREQYDQF
jgi:DNA polymerase III subunit epsilon